MILNREKSMKLKVDFIVKNVADKSVAIAVDGAKVGFDGMLTMNESAAFILECLKVDTTIEEIVKKFLDEYDATREQAENTIANFVSKLREAGLVEE